MLERLNDRQIRVMKLDIFADQRDPDLLLTAVDPCQHLLPFGQIDRHVLVQMKLAKRDPGQACILKHERSLIQNRKSQILNDTILLDIAEHRNLSEDTLLDGLVAARHDDVREDSVGLKLSDRMLRRLGLMLPGGFQIGNQRHVDIQAVFLSHLVAHLTDGFQKWLRLDVTGRTADLRNDDIGVSLLSDLVDE